MQREVIMERFFNSLISGDRAAARQIVDDLLEADCRAELIMQNLFWPTLEQIQKLFRHDQLSDMAHHYATRMLRMLVDQMQLRLEQSEQPRDRRTLVVCGPEESEEIGAQMLADLLEAAGYSVYFAGGGVANDEIVQQVGELEIDHLVIFGVVPSTVPFTRLLIDHLHDIGACPHLQIVVGGGVFNRAEGLAEEIGADLWARDPQGVLQAIQEQPDRRMTADQRTVGRKQRTRKKANAA